VQVDWAVVFVYVPAGQRAHVYFAAVVCDEVCEPAVPATVTVVIVAYIAAADTAFAVPASQGRQAALLVASVAVEE
jgi:hypothetical protein